MRESRYSSIVKWKVSRSLTLTGTEVWLATMHIREQNERPTPQNLANLLDSQELSRLRLSKSTQPTAKKDGEALEDVHQSGDLSISSLCLTHTTLSICRDQA